MVDQNINKNVNNDNKNAQDINNQNPFVDSKKQKQDVNQEVLRTVIDGAKRLRLLEDRYTTIRKKTQLTDQNMLEANKQFNSEFRAINDEIDKLKILMKEMNEKLDQLISESSGLAKRQDLITLSKYVDLWKPMEFVTREQLEREFKLRK